MLGHAEANVLVTDTSRPTSAPRSRTWPGSRVLDVVDALGPAATDPPRASADGAEYKRSRRGDAAFEWQRLRTRGRRSRSTHPGTTDTRGRAYITIAEPTERCCRKSSTGACRDTRLLWTLRCLNATAGAPLEDGGGDRGHQCVPAPGRGAEDLRAIRAHEVSHYCGAPIVHSTLINAPEAMKKGIAHRVSGLVAAAAPPAAMIEGMEKLGFDITHVYGLTETYGPASVCAKHAAWDALDIGARTSLTAGRAFATHAGRHDGDGPETMTPCRATGPRWARSCSAATSR